MITGLLSSCVTVNSQDIAPQTKFNISILEPQLTSLTKWQARGVIGIVYNNHADSANYVYLQDGDTFSVTFYGPLGIGSIEIFSDKNMVTLKSSDGKVTKSSDVKSLMIQQLGWYFPIDGLKYWIKSTVVPDLPSKQRHDPSKLMSQLSQDGWVIDYKHYKLVDGKYPLPTNIKMTRDNMSLKIIIKVWQV